MKKLLIIIVFIVLTGCQKESTTKITLSPNLNYNFNETINLYDLVSISDGKIITPNYQINTTTLGEKNISFKYYDSNKWKKKYEFTINIKDSTKPLILSSSTLYIKTSDDINIIDKIIVADNYDDKVKKEIIGEYNLNKKGEYNLKFIATDSSNNQSTKDIKLIVTNNLPKSSSKKTINIDNAIKKYKNNSTSIGIDVSKWQGNIDFDKIKKSGVEFVIIRIGYGHSNNQNHLDEYFQNNLKKAKEAGLKIGVYFYSYAKSINEAKEQAKWIIKNLNNETLELPIAFDWEVWSNFNKYELSIYELNLIADTFLKEIIKSGYQGMLYSSKYYLENIWNLPNYPTWLAHYTDKTDYQNDYYIWQASSTMRIDGINGNVDLNILYK